MARASTRPALAILSFLTHVLAALQLNPEASAAISPAPGDGDGHGKSGFGPNCATPRSVNERFVIDGDARRIQSRSPTRCRTLGRTLHLNKLVHRPSNLSIERRPSSSIAIDWPAPIKVFGPSQRLPLKCWICIDNSSPQGIYRGAQRVIDVHRDCLARVST